MMGEFYIGREKQERFESTLENCGWFFCYSKPDLKIELDYGTAFLFGSMNWDYCAFPNEAASLEAMFSDAASEKRALHGFCVVVFIRLDGQIEIISDQDNYSHFLVNKTNGFEFYSGMNSFRKVNDATASNEKAKYFSLVYGFYPGNQTVYEGLFKVSHGNGYVLDEEGAFETKFHDVNIQLEDPKQNQEYFVEAIHSEMMDSLNCLKTKTNRVAVLLGGFDSALVAAMACKLGFEVETFTFYYESEDFNQKNIERLVSETGVKHNWIKIDAEVIRNGFMEYPELYSNPTNWPNYLIQSTHLANEIKKKGFEVILTGDGCDGIFQGYPGVYKSAQLFSKAGVLKSVAGILSPLAKFSASEYLLGHVYRLFMRVLRNYNASPKERIFLMYRIFDEYSLSRVFNEPVKKIESEVAAVRDEFIGNLPDVSLTRLAYLGKSNMGPNRAKIKGIVDATGIFVFSPYMHFRLKKLVSTIPEEYLRPTDNPDTSDIGKYILTEMTKRKSLLSNELIFQPKQSAVDAPIDDWMENELHDYIVNKVGSFEELNLNFVRRMFKPKLAEKIYRRFLSSDAITSHAPALLFVDLLYKNRPNSG